jgi:hypothetical protein
VRGALQPYHIHRFVIRELAVWRARRRLVRAERVLDQPFSRERSLRLDAALLAYEQAWGRP